MLNPGWEHYDSIKKHGVMQKNSRARREDFEWKQKLRTFDDESFDDAWLLFCCFKN